MSDEKRRDTREMSRISGSVADDSKGQASRARNRTVLLSPEHIGQIRATLVTEQDLPAVDDTVGDLMPPMGWDYNDGKASDGTPPPRDPNDGFRPVGRQNPETPEQRRGGSGTSSMRQMSAPAEAPVRQESPRPEPRASSGTAGYGSRPAFPASSQATPPPAQPAAPERQSRERTSSAVHRIIVPSDSGPAPERPSPERAAAERPAADRMEPRPGASVHQPAQEQYAPPAARAAESFSPPAPEPAPEPPVAPRPAPEAPLSSRPAPPPPRDRAPSQAPIQSQASPVRSQAPETNANLNGEYAPVRGEKGGIQVTARGQKTKIVGFFVSFDTDTLGEILELRVGRWLVTSRPTDQGDYILIDDTTISPLHAIIRATNDGQVQVLDQLSEYGSGVTRAGSAEEESLTGALANLNHGDIVRLGNRKFAVCLLPKMK